MSFTKLSERDSKYLDNTFTYHAPTGRSMPLYIGLRAAGKFFARMLLTLLPESRERSTALTHIESACFWANACVARNEDRLPPYTVQVVAPDSDVPEITLLPIEVPVAPIQEDQGRE